MGAMAPCGSLTLFLPPIRLYPFLSRTSNTYAPEPGHDGRGLTATQLMEMVGAGRASSSSIARWTSQVPVPASEAEVVRMVAVTCEGM